MKRIKRIKPRNKVRTIILSSVWIVFLLVVWKYILPGLILAFTFIYLSVADGFVRIYNPSERNYLVFENESVESVVDSIYVFHDLLKEMNLVEHPSIKNTVYFSYKNTELFINERYAGDFNFEFIRRDPSMIYASDEQVKHFIDLYNFLLDNYIDPSSFNLSSGTLTLNYKSLYKMYPDNKAGIEIEDFRLIEVLPSTFSVIDDYFMILDSFNNVYLTAYKQKKVKSDDTKYVRKER